MDHIQGRNDLLAWDASKPDNFFDADYNLQYVLQRYMGANAYNASKQNFSQFGNHAATTINQAAKIEDRRDNHPRLERWSNLGERMEQIEFHPNHDVIGKLVWESGMMALQTDAGNTVEQMGLVYLLGHNGEAGHMCSVACTSGLIRALQKAADDDLQTRFLPPLLNPNYDQMQHGAQFLTEAQGGSDVGANAIQATPDQDGTWRITGEKWFCSNINADQFLMTARVSDAAGTRGLGLFLVPRLLSDGNTNDFYIRRLKDKLGTRTLASAELDFRGAVAYPVGDISSGFKTVVELVLNTSRLLNAITCAGVMRRAYIEAGHYACHRQAFGQKIGDFPLVQEAVADIMTEYYAATASGFYLAHLLDKIETGNASEQDQATYRILVNLNKYITSINGTYMVHRAIEVLGGNGAIESFSILPRLYRDMVVLESWEGTHNVLAAQVMRDIQKYQIHEPFIANMQTQLQTVTDSTLQPAVGLVHAAIHRLYQYLENMQQQGMEYAQAHSRRFIDLASYTAQATLLLAEAQWELEQNLPTVKPNVIDYFINKHLNPSYDILTDLAYTGRLQRLMSALELITPEHA